MRLRQVGLQRQCTLHCLPRLLITLRHGYPALIRLSRVRRAQQRPGERELRIALHRLLQILEHLRYVL